MALVHEKILEVMRSIGAIGKDQTNKFDKYNFRGIDDVYNVLGPKLANAGVFVSPSIESRETVEMTTGKGAKMQHTHVTVTYTFWAEDGSEVSCRVPGEGADRGDKSVNKAMSSAFKTAMFQALCIPTHEQSDSENESPDLSGGKAEPQGATAEQPGAAAITRVRRAAMSRCTALDVAPANYGPLCIVDALRAVGVDDADGGNYPGKLAQLSDEKLDTLDAHIEAWKPQDTAPKFVEGEAAA